MIYTAKELLGKLNNLTLVGQNFDGELEWIGNERDWDRSEEDDFSGASYKEGNDR